MGERSWPIQLNLSYYSTITSPSPVRRIKGNKPSRRMASLQQSKSKASSSKLPERTKKPQRPSCDACKLRKIRCDRKNKVDERAQELGIVAESLPPEEEANLTCSLCLNHGLRCTFIQASKTKNRKGRRIMEIQRTQLESYEEEGEQHQYSSKQPRRSITESSGQKGATMIITTPPSSHSILSPPKIVSSGVLQVEGLTRSLLEHCIKMFFTYVFPSKPVLHPEKFSQAYANFWLPVEQQQACQPPDDLLLLAVATLGAGLLQPPIAARGSNAKFKLQDRMVLRYLEIFQERDWTDWYLRRNACDVLEAIYLMVDMYHDLVDTEETGQFRKSNDGGPSWPLKKSAHVQEGLLMEEKASMPTMTRFTKQRQRDILLQDPFSHEFLVQMMRQLQVNRRPKARIGCLPGETLTFEDYHGTCITTEEHHRRMRIFWLIFTKDTFHSFGKRISPLIGEDDYDQELPRWLVSSELYQKPTIPREEVAGPLKDYSIYKPISLADAFASPANATMQPTRFLRFDGLIMEHSLRLVFIVRSAFLHFASPRSQGKGIKIREVERATNVLEAWKNQVPNEIQWDTHSGPLLSKETTSASTFINLDTAHRNAIKALILEYLYHGVVLGVWATVKDFGIRLDQDPNEAAALVLSRLGLDEELNDGRVESDQVPIVKNRLEAIIVESFFRLSKIAKEAHQLDYLRSSRAVFLGISGGFAYFGTELARRLRSSDPTMASLALECSEAIIDSIKSIDSFQGVGAVTRQMKGWVRGVRGEEREAAGGDFDSSTSSTTPRSGSTWPYPQQTHEANGEEDDDVRMLSSNAKSDNSWLSDWLAQETFQYPAEVVYDDDEHQAAAHGIDFVMPSLDEIQAWAQSSM